jgi:two-component system, NarL family, response regulator NreC
VIRVLVADPYPRLRQAVRALLEREPDLHVVGEAIGGFQALQLVEQHCPDVLLLELTLPGLEGLQVARQVRQRFAGTRIVVHSMHATEDYVRDALAVGASAYVVKGSTANELGRAIREAAQGRRYLSPPLPQHLLDQATEE